MYAKEQMKLGFRVLSQSSVYKCLKQRFCVQKKLPFKDSQCADCVNSSLLEDALIVTRIRGIKRRNTENVSNSFCPLGEKDKSPSVQNDQGISRNCKRCGAINTLQESIIKQNPEVDWSKQVTWHQWQYILLDTGEKDGKKK